MPNIDKLRKTATASVIDKSLEKIDPIDIMPKLRITEAKILRNLNHPASHQPLIDLNQFFNGLIY